MSTLEEGDNGHASNGKKNDSLYWQCILEANILDEEARDVVQVDGEPTKAYLKCIAKRVALPWMKYDNLSKQDLEDEDLDEEEKEGIQFATLEEAEALAEKH